MGRDGVLDYDKDAERRLRKLSPGSESGAIERWETAARRAFAGVVFALASMLTVQTATASPGGVALRYSAQPVGEAMTGRPWITHVAIADLDRDGLPDILACDAQTNTVRWVRQSARGVFEERSIGEAMAPAHVAVADLNGSGRLDVLVASMGQIFPSNDRIGSVIVFENLGQGEFRSRTILDRAARVSDVRAADFDGDGRLDLAVGQFGYEQGEIRWMRNRGGWEFESHVIGGLSGKIHSFFCGAPGHVDGSPGVCCFGTHP